MSGQIFIFSLKLILDQRRTSREQVDLDQVRVVGIIGWRRFGQVRGRELRHSVGVSRIKNTTSRQGDVFEWASVGGGHSPLRREGDVGQVQKIVEARSVSRIERRER